MRTCWDLALWLEPIEAVVMVDLMLRTGRVNASGLEAYVAHRVGHHGWRRCAAVMKLADGRSESPQESRLRVMLVQAGLKDLQVQYQIFSANGTFLARVDLALLEYKIAIEYDGLHHVGSAIHMNRDRRRLNEILAEGWVVLHVTAPHLRGDFPRLLDEIHAVIRARRAAA